jgi:hypothetical protein
MRSYFFPAILLFISAFLACNKDDNNNSNQLKLLDYTTSDYYPDTSFYRYNNNNQIIGFEAYGDSSYITINGNQLHFTEYRKTESRTTAFATFTLNAEGNVISGLGSFSYDLSSPYTAIFSFTYDAEGHMTNKTEARSDGMTYSYDFGWTNGDLTTITWNFNGNLYLTNYLSYDVNSGNKLKIDNATFFIPVNDFTGKGSAHLIKGEYSIFAPGTTIDNMLDFTYTLDADGYPLTETVDEVSPAYHEVTTYHYQ